MADELQLSRRERQIMDVVWRKGEASVSQVVAEIPRPPTRTSVRTLMRIMEDKGHLAHRVEGREFIYRPARPRARSGRRALQRVLQTFFRGSLGDALAAHLADPNAILSDEELSRLMALIQQARKKGKPS